MPVFQDFLFSSNFDTKNTKNSGKSKLTNFILGIFHGMDLVNKYYRPFPSITRSTEGTEKKPILAHGEIAMGKNILARVS
jgi:hypothetical protein